MYNTLLELYLRDHNLIIKTQPKPDAASGTGALTVSDMEKHDAKHNEQLLGGHPGGAEDGAGAEATELSTSTTQKEKHDAEAVKKQEDQVFCCFFLMGWVFLNL